MKNLFFAAAFLAASGLGARVASADGDGMSWSAKEDIVQQFIQKFNSGDIEGARATFTVDAESQGVLGWGKIETQLPIWKALYESLQVRVTVDSMISEGDLVAVRLTERGTSMKPVFGQPVTGKRYQILAMEWFEIENGKIRRRWSVRDTGSMAQQLGWASPITRDDVRFPRAK